MGYVIPPVCSGSALGSPPSSTCPENLQRKVFRRHPNQMPEPPQLVLFNAKQQRFYFEPLWMSVHPISMGEPSQL
ncbi:hypothetical protein LDENG_00062700 [Lucifuga dentata]|nr:hypothetical protein LDENG_00062700 [Lucifuga dentata]